MSQRIQTFPQAYERAISSELARLGYSLDEPRPLAQAVQRMSDLYTQDALAPTPWHQPWARAAQLAYYFPLNHARARAVALEAERTGFLEGLNALTDFGSGAGAALFAFAEKMPTAVLTAVDSSSEALDLGAALTTGRMHTRQISQSARTTRGRAQGLLLASFSFTESASFPDDWHDFEALAIIEPSTQEDGRRLMTERQRLIDRGYSIWAPCTHQLACPLLTQSARDWCHDRIHWHAPEWFLAIEKHLPMKNRTLTFSYLLAHHSRAPSPALTAFARLTGDMLPEKGKTRQSLCRGPEREFLAWFPQRLAKGETIELQRGDLIEVKETELRANEVRIKASPRVLAPDERP